MNHFLKIAVPKFSKYIIRETITILAKKKPKKRGVLVSKIETYKGVLVSKILTIYIGHLRETHVETATRKLETSEENRVDSLTGSEQVHFAGS